MCGIAGVMSLTGNAAIEEELLYRQLAILEHRGPDESGVYVDQRIGLASARLSIIGLEGGVQPISNEDGSLWIAYNGEVFNYPELRTWLVRRGHRFATETDTEVVLHLFEEEGPAALHRLNGQFAMAIWNARTRELFLARDRVGIRPLYFSTVGDKLLFASEIKALFLDPDVRRAIDHRSLVQVFTLWTTLGERTAFEGVSELPPGHYMWVREGRVQRHRYWDVPLDEERESPLRSIDEAVDELEELVVDAVRLRLRADVPVGAYLSGGLDSSLTTAVIARHFENHLRTFSVSFEERRFDERDYQDALVQELGTDHSRIVVSNADIADHLADVIWHCEAPLLRTGPVPLYLLSDLVRRSGFKVVVSGEGADEVFGGYNIFKEAKVRRFWGKHPESTWRPLLLERLYPYVFADPARSRHFLRKFYEVRSGELEDPLFSHLPRWRNTSAVTAFLTKERLAEVGEYDPIDDVRATLPDSFGRRRWLSRAQTLEISGFLSNYLLSSQGDRVAMAHSVEGRVPFLDHRIMRFAFGLPARWKIRGLDEKHVLKRLARRYLPPMFAHRPKQPYRAPITEALSGAAGTSLVPLLASENLVRSSHFDPRKVALLVRRVEQGKGLSEVQNMALTGIVTTQLLQSRFIDAFPSTIRPRVPDKVVRRHPQMSTKPTSSAGAP